MAQLTKEQTAYHFLNVALGGEYRKLKQLKSKYSSWNGAWHRLAAEFKNINPETERRRLESSKLRLILIEEKEYPPSLREIPHPPLGIYCRGTLPPAESLAIVGTRKATPEGKEIAETFAARLAQAGLGIISGLAFGIDISAHQGALRARGKTWAVLAGGADTIYPASHARIGEKIVAGGGGIISEYPPASPPLPYRFLERNRIISGLCRGTLIVEAPAVSGALATARFTLDQNRELFVIPGPIHHPNFRGSNSLIRAGAELVTSPEDILETLGINPSSRPPNIFSSPEEEKIIRTLRDAARPLTIDKILELTNLEAQAANRILSFLIARGEIIENGSGYFLNK